MSLLKQLEAKLVIDEHALDIALREHPDLLYKVASELALAISNRDEAKQELEQIQAQVDSELRKAALISDQKVTETSIQSNKNTDKRVIAANDVFLEKSYEAAKWTALRSAYEQRSYSLSKLVDLFLANYFSTNEDKKTGGAAVRDVRANQVKEVNRSRRIAP